MQQTSTTAKVQVTIEVTVGSSWGEDCTNKQVFDQAIREALGAVKTMVAVRRPRDMRIVGEPTVEYITRVRA